MIGLEIGGGKRDRTDDLLHAMQPLSQLSYTPVSERIYIRIGIGLVNRFVCEKLTKKPRKFAGLKIKGLSLATCTCAGCFLCFLFARLFVVAVIAHFFHYALFVEFLLESTQSFLYWFAFAKFYFTSCFCHLNHYSLLALKS